MNACDIAKLRALCRPVLFCLVLLSKSLRWRRCCSYQMKSAPTLSLMPLCASLSASCYLLHSLTNLQWLLQSHWAASQCIFPQQCGICSHKLHLFSNKTLQWLHNGNCWTEDCVMLLLFPLMLCNNNLLFYELSLNTPLPSFPVLTWRMDCRWGAAPWTPRPALAPVGSSSPTSLTASGGNPSSTAPTLTLTFHPKVLPETPPPPATCESTPPHSDEQIPPCDLWPLGYSMVRRTEF